MPEIEGMVARSRGLLGLGSGLMLLGFQMTLGLWKEMLAGMGESYS